MADVKAYIQSNETASFTCPECRYTKVIRTAKIPGHKTLVKVRCDCGTVINVNLEHRHHYRKKADFPGTYSILAHNHGDNDQAGSKSVKLPGTYAIVGRGQGNIQMMVTDISMGGIGFAVTGTHYIKKGQIIDIHFELNDRNQTQVNKKVEVITVTKDKVGTRFLDTKDIGKALGFYLMS